MINKIKGLKKFTDCSMPSDEGERMHKAEVAAYNRAIEDVVKVLAIKGDGRCVDCIEEENFYDETMKGTVIVM